MMNTILRRFFNCIDKRSFSKAKVCYARNYQELRIGRSSFHQSSRINDEGGTIYKSEVAKEIPIEGVEADLSFSPGVQTTYIQEEVDKFRHFADSWWDERGECMPLHSLNKLRVALVRDGLMQSPLSDPNYVDGPQPLKGLRILDVGCGGGILCEPLARLGATVVGLDAAEENVEVARHHASLDKKVLSNVTYIPGTVEDHAETVTDLYDAVVASEVLEHVHSVELFVNTCISVLKPGGSFFATTINKTKRSWLGAIAIGEYLLRILPKGTHDWNKFVPQQDLKLLLERGGCSVLLMHGMAYVPFVNEWFWISDPSVCYAIQAVKNKME